MSGDENMPNKDGTGPQGKGSKTGRQEGNCQNAEPIVRGQGKGCCGKRQGRGNGQGCRNKKTE